MPLPTVNEVHVNRPLTNIAVAWRQSADLYIATKVFPTVPVAKQSDLYFVFDRADFLRDMAQPRGPSQESAGSGYSVSTASYTATVYAFHKDVDDQVRANTDNPLDAERNATEFVTQVLMTRLEREWATKYFASGIWGTDATPSPTWDDVTSRPIKDVKAGIKTILQNTGYMPNTLVLGYEVYEALMDHPTITDRVKFGGLGDTRVVTPQVLAQLFGVERVLIARAVYNAATQGATASYAFVHGKHALLCYTADRPSIDRPSAGYVFEWTGISQGLGETLAVTRIPMPWLGQNNVRVEGQIAFDAKVVAPELGYFFNGAVA